MATTLTKTGWFGKTSGAWSKTAGSSNTVVDTVDGIKIPWSLPQGVLNGVTPNPITPGDGNITLTGDASNRASQNNYWNNYGINNQGIVVFGNGNSSVSGTGAYGISSVGMFFGDGNNTVTGTAKIKLPSKFTQSVFLTGIDNGGIIQFGNGNNTLTGIGFQYRAPRNPNGGGGLSGNGYAGISNYGSILFGSGNNTVDALVGGFDGDGYIEFGAGKNTVKGFGQVSIDGGGNVDTKLLLNPGTYQIVANIAGGPYIPFQVTQTGAYSNDLGQYAQMDITGIPLVGVASNGNTTTLKQGTLTVESNGQFIFENAIGNDAYMVYDPTTHTAANPFVDGSWGTWDQINQEQVYYTHEVRFASATAGQKLTLLAEDTGVGSVTIGTGTAANANTSAKIALDVDASKVAQSLRIKGNNGNNKLTGGSGDDKFISSFGNDTIKGGAGNNSVDYSANPTGIAVTIGAASLVNKGVGRGTDTLTAIQKIIATANSDTITGDSNSNTLVGGLGVDSLNGVDGGDTYEFNDSLDHSSSEIRDSGATGIDTILFNSNVEGQALTLFAGDTGMEAVKLGKQLTSRYYTWSDGYGYSKPEDGTTGTVETALNVDAAAVLNQLTIYGSDGDNTIQATALDDIVYGGNGIDRINGGDGKDTIFGGLGNDILTGGNGEDTFVIDSRSDSNANRDVITDFASGVDKLQFKTSGRFWNEQGLWSITRDYDYNTGTYAITSNSFFSGASVTQATAPDQRFLYDTSTGILGFDRDGSLSSYGVVQVAVLGINSYSSLAYTDIRINHNYV